MKMIDDIKMSEDIGICPRCNNSFKKKAPNQIFCGPECRACHHSQNYQTNYNKELRKRVYYIFGDSCASCGETDPIVLTIDHIEPCGKNRKQTPTLYVEIISNPESAKKKYQLLCRNCNWRKMVQNGEGKGQRDNDLVTHFEMEEVITEVNHSIASLKNKIDLVNSNLNGGIIQQSWHVDEELIEIAYPLRLKFIDPSGKISARDLRLILRDKGIKIGMNKSYDVKRALELKYPKDFITGV